MKTKWNTRAALITVGWTASLITLLSAEARAQTDLPLWETNYQQTVPRGFGDRNNSWAQAMIYWRGHVYVGTSRQSVCTSLYGIYQFAVALVSKSFADTFLPYPPRDPDLSCAPDAADLALQAEIWRAAPETNVWKRVFQSPATLDNPGPGAPVPPRVGKKLPYEISIRGFAAHTESDGTEALYAFGINSTVLWDRSKLPPPRILRTTDGVNWTSLPQAPGTFLHDLPFNPDHSSFRSPVSLDGKLFVLSGPIFGQGSLIGSANPAQGNNAWFLASPPGLLFYELRAFNGWLYVGGFDPSAGYAVFKTRVTGPPPYQLTTVIPAGAFLTVRPSKSVVSMHVYRGRLYVGTATQTEIIRINPDDTWDLVIGPPRVALSPTGGAEWKYPISGLDAGFGHTLNDHAWQMDDPYGYLYVGTYNASTPTRLDPVNGPLLKHNMGAHLYRTPDGWYYNPITTNGFTNLYDPYGGIFDYGIRTMVSTPFGPFLGTANDYYGLGIFRAVRRAPAAIPPGRVEIEPAKTGGALLSWVASPGAKLYKIWRAEIRPILVRDDTNFEGWNGVTGNKIPDIYITPYQVVGVTSNTFFIDLKIQTGKRYMYYVTAESKTGKTSERSNLVTFPLLTPPVTFAQLLREVDNLTRRQRFRSPELQMKARQQVLDAKTFAGACQILRALDKLNQLKISDPVLDPDSTDFEILISKLIRRLQLFSLLPKQVHTDEFCLGAPQ